MGKRSNFARRERDCYDSPYEVVTPLLPHLIPATQYIEPCAGAYKLASHLNQNGHQCVAAFDIDPRDDRVNYCLESFTLTNLPYPVITNPPWSRPILHNLIERWRFEVPYSWLLIDANWMFTRQAAPYLTHCSKIVTIGRVKWIPDSKMTGKDDACWYKFEPAMCETVFYGRSSRV